MKQDWFIGIFELADSMWLGSGIFSAFWFAMTDLW
jgi:hypothetical protein